MCFSAQASFTAAAVLGTIGIASVYRASTIPLRLIASAPLFFALQQLLEGFVWLTLSNPESISHMIGLYGFTFFAGAWWPAAIPLVLRYAEPIMETYRKELLYWCCLAGGFFASIWLLLCAFTGVEVHAVHHHLSYALLGTIQSHPWFAYFYYIGIILYLIATVGAMMISSVAYMWVVGLLVSTSFIAAQLSYAHAFGSVWCFFAAIISATVYGIVWYNNPKRM